VWKKGGKEGGERKKGGRRDYSSRPGKGDTCRRKKKGRECEASRKKPGLKRGGSSRWGERKGLWPFAKKGWGDWRMLKSGGKKKSLSSLSGKSGENVSKKEEGYIWGRKGSDNEY